MRRIHPRTPAWRLFGTALVLLALAEAGAAQEIAAPSLSVGGERTSRAAEFERLLPMLGDPITADDALCAIRDLGAPAVALLRQELGATKGEELPVPVLIGAVRTLGAIGKPATEALPELLARIHDANPAVQHQVLWSLSRIAVHASAAQCKAIAAAWVAGPHRGFGDAERLRLVEVLDAVLSLQGSINLRWLESDLADPFGGHYFMVWSRVEEPRTTSRFLWLGAHEDQIQSRRSRFVELLRLQLREVLLCPTLSSLLPIDLLRAPACSTLASLLRRLEEGRMDVEIARGLLHSYDVDERRAAVAAIEGLAGTLTSAACADLCLLLWDPDPAVSLPAVRALKAAGVAAAIALPALRHAEDSRDEPFMRRACRDAADHIVAAHRISEPAVRATIERLDALFERGVDPGFGPFDDATWSIVVRGLVWAPPRAVDLLVARCQIPRVMSLTFNFPGWREAADHVRAWIRDGRRGPSLPLDGDVGWFRCGTGASSTPLFPRPTLSAGR